jgi:serine/threonine protein kinase
VRERLDPRYAAPEVYDDPRSATAASDIYSLGIIFYQIITSEVPYASIAEVRKQGVETPLDLELLLAKLGSPEGANYMNSPKDAAEVIARMCHQDPSQRHQTVDEVAEDLSIIADASE